MGVNDSMGAGVGDIVHHLFSLDINTNSRVICSPHSRQILQIVTVERSSHAIGRQSLHQELNSEDVHATIDQCLNCASIRENVVSSLQDGQALLANKVRHNYERVYSPRLRADYPHQIQHRIHLFQTL